MKKLRYVSIAVVCIALWLPLVVWGADASEPAPVTVSTPAVDQSSDLARLKVQLELQERQIRDLQIALQEQKKLLDQVRALEAAAPAAPPAPASEPDHKAPNLGDVASTTPIIPSGVAPSRPVPPALIPKAALPGQTAAEAVPDSPLQLRIGATTITPIGFIDATNTWRSTNSGANLATNFGSYPYNNVTAGRLSENKMSLQNSRIGMRLDSTYKGYHVLGYYEGDFVGGLASNNTQVTSYSMSYRLRLFWVQIRKNHWEFLAGQSWSLLTPNRRGISPLPGDLFYGNEFDVNYLNGLTWGRIPGFRFVYHANSHVAWAIAAENADQYFGGSGGGGVPTLPAALAALGSSEVDDSLANGYNLPNLHPDFITKLAFDPSSKAHIEVNGVVGSVRLFNNLQPPYPGAQQHFTETGGGGSINANIEIFKNFRLLTNNFWGDGVGRYIFGTVPNFIIRADGHPSLIHAGSTVDGFEWTVGKSQIYGYYGGIYAGRNTALDADGKTLIGYGYHGSPNGQNRTMQEGTIGLTQTLYRDPKYGQVSFYLDYAYFWRYPWYVAPNAPKGAIQHAVWFNLRYTFPGQAPTIEY